MKRMFSLTVLVVLLLALVPVPASAQEGVECAEEVVVQKDDWLSKYGDKFFGNILSWPAIMAWNNQAAAAEPDKYDWIENPDLIEVGWWPRTIPAKLSCCTLIGKWRRVSSRGAAHCGLNMPGCLTWRTQPRMASVPAMSGCRSQNL